MTNLYLWLVLAVGICIGGLCASALFIPYLRDAERYRWLRDQCSVLVPSSAISRWLFHRPFGREELDTVVDKGMGRLEDQA